VLNERIAEAEQGFAEDQAYLEKRTAEQIAELHYRLEAERGTALRLRVKSVLAS
jgi:predicted ABC-type transport system involved in lysophospholipase L1 biosynthesis ATPase subunit